MRELSFYDGEDSNRGLLGCDVT